jgi:hypothetical protein
MLVRPLSPATLHSSLALIFRRRTGQVSEARQVFEMLTQKFPSFSDLWNNLGTVHLLENNVCLHFTARAYTLLT